MGVLAVRGARLPRHQDLGQAQRPGGHGPRLRAAGRAVRLPAAPRRHRGRPGLPGHDQVRRRLRRPAVAGHRRHDPRLPLRPAGGGGQGRQPDPGVAEPAPARPGDRQLPVLRPRPGRRLHARRGGHRRPGGHGGAAARRRHGLRRQRSGRGAGGRPRGGLGQRQGPDLRQGRGHQDRARVADRRDPHRGGHADRRGADAAGPPPARPSSASADPPDRPPVLRTPTARVLDEADEAGRPPAAGHRPGRGLRPRRPGRGRRHGAGVARRAALGLRRGARPGGGLPGRGQPDPLRRARGRARGRGRVRRAGPAGRPALLDDRRSGRLRGAAVGPAGPALGAGPRPPPRPAAHGHRPPARRGRRAAGAAGAPGGAGDPAAGGRRHVHRGGRRQPAPGRRRRRLPRPVAELVGPGSRWPGSRTARCCSRPRSARSPGRPARCRASGWRRPTAAAASARRGPPRSWSTPAPSIAPVVSLYVNDFNPAARAAYRRVGFREVGQYASVLF